MLIYYENGYWISEVHHYSSIIKSNKILFFSSSFCRCCLREMKWKESPIPKVTLFSCIIQYPIDGSTKKQLKVLCIRYITDILKYSWIYSLHYVFICMHYYLHILIWIIWLNWHLKIAHKNDQIRWEVHFAFLLTNQQFANGKQK